MSHDVLLKVKYHTPKFYWKVGEVRKETKTKKGNFEEEKSDALCIATTNLFVQKEANLKVSGVY